MTNGGHPGGAAASVGPDGACTPTRSKKSSAARRAQRHRAMARLQNWAWHAGWVAACDGWYMDVAGCTGAVTPQTAPVVPNAGAAGTADGQRALAQAAESGAVKKLDTMTAEELRRMAVRQGAPFKFVKSATLQRLREWLVNFDLNYPDMGATHTDLLGVDVLASQSADTVALMEATNTTPSVREANLPGGGDGHAVIAENTGDLLGTSGSRDSADLVVVSPGTTAGDSSLDGLTARGMPATSNATLSSQTDTTQILPTASNTIPMVDMESGQSTFRMTQAVEIKRLSESNRVARYLRLGEPLTAKSAELLREAVLRVAGDGSAGLEMSTCDGGYHVDALINDSNSDALAVGDVIVAIEGQLLLGQDAGDIEERFDAAFHDGASLLVGAVDRLQELPLADVRELVRNNVACAKVRAANLPDSCESEAAACLTADEQETLRLQAFRAVAKDDSEALADILAKVPRSTWSRWQNKAAKDLFTLSQERGSPVTHSMMAKILGVWRPDELVELRRQAVSLDMTSRRASTATEAELRAYITTQQQQRMEIDAWYRREFADKIRRETHAEYVTDGTDEVSLMKDGSVASHS